MEFKKLSFIPSICPKILLPFWWIILLVFYIIYSPLYSIVWFFCPVKRKKKQLIRLDSEYRRDRH